MKNIELVLFFLFFCVPILIKAQCTVSISSNPAAGLCEGTNVTFTANISGTAPYSYQWSSSGSINGATNLNYITSVSGTYTVNVTVTGGQTCTSNAIVLNPLPAANAGTNKTNCSGESIQIGDVALSGNTYSWTSNPPGFSSATSNPSVSPTITTTYTIKEIISATGCQKTNTVIITVNPSPAANAGNATSICSGLSTSIGAKAVTGNTYNWTSNPAGYTSTAANPSVSPTVTTTYTLTETITATNCQKTNTVVVTVNPLPQIPGFNVPPIACANTSFSFTNVTPPGLKSYSWNFGGDPPSQTWTDNRDVSHCFLTAVGNPNITFSVTLTVTDTKGCQNKKSQDVTVKQIPDAKLTSDETGGFENRPPTGTPTQFINCGGIEPYVLTLINLSTTNNQNYLINWGEGPNKIYTTFSPSPQHSYSTVGSFTLTNIVTGANGCIASQSYKVFIGTNPMNTTITNTSPTTGGCAPQKYKFKITYGPNDAPGTKYIIEHNDGTKSDTLIKPFPPDSLPGIIEHEFKTTSCGATGAHKLNTFFISITAINECGMSSTNTFEPIVLSSTPKPLFDISPPPYCVNNPQVDFTSTSNGGGYVYWDGSNWVCDSKIHLYWSITGTQNVDWQVISPGNLGSSSSFNGTDNISLKFINSGTYTIKLITGNKGLICTQDTLIKTICVRPQPNASFNVDKTIFCLPGDVIFTNTSINDNTCVPISYTWSIADCECLQTDCDTQTNCSSYSFINSNSSSVSPTIRFTQPGKYTINLKANNGCNPANFTKIITVKSKPTLTFDIPQSICQGQTISPCATFKSCYGSMSTPLYSWSFPGGNPASSTFQCPGNITYNTSGTNTISLTVSNECGSNPIQKQLTIIPNLPVSLAITASANPVCAVTGVTFIATATNGGTTPIFQWKVGSTIVGGNFNSYTYIPANGDVITCTVTSSEKCTTGNPASNSITMTVNPIKPVSVSISASANPVCTGTPVTYTATPTNGGSAPSYQWKVNNVNKGTSSIYTYTPANGDIITCILTSNVTCPTGNPATSNIITMTVNSILPVSLTITASSNQVCAGISVIFTATPTNGGSPPSYQWKVNSVKVGTNNNTYSYIPVNGDIITCVLTSNSTCATGNPATSNTITMTVNPIPSAVITETGSTSFCSGDHVVLEANIGTGLKYQWLNNGNSIFNETNSSYSATQSGDYTCVITDNTTISKCKNTSNIITVTVHSIFCNALADLNNISKDMWTTLRCNPTTNPNSSSYSYNWSPTTDIKTGDEQSQTPQTNKLINTTTFTVTVTDNNQPHCSAVCNVTVSVTGAALSVEVPDLSICYGTCTNITATPSGGSGNNSYQWSSNPSSNITAEKNPKVCPTITTTYTVTVNDGYNTASDMAIVTVIPLPPSRIDKPTKDTAICTGNYAKLIANSGNGLKYQWLINENSISNATNSNFDARQSGAYKCVITNNPTTPNCSNTSNVITVSVHSISCNALADQNNIHNGMWTTLHCNPTSNPVSSSYLYSWSPTTDIRTGDENSQNPQTKNLNSTKTFTVTVTENNFPSCQAVCNVTETVTGGPLKVDVPDLVICTGDCTNINPTYTGGTENYTYQWSSNPPSFNSSIDSPNLCPTITTTYTVTVNDGYNTVSDFGVVTVFPLPESKIISPIADTIICPGGQAKLKANTGNGLTYQWLKDGITILNATNSSYTATTNGIYSVMITETINNHCKKESNKIKVTVDKFTVDAGLDKTIPCGTSTKLSGSIPNGGYFPYTYNWTPTGGIASGGNDLNPTTTNIDIATVFTLTAIDKYGCSANDNLTVYISGSGLSIAAIADPGTICIGNSIKLTSKATGGSGIYTYSWTSDPPDGTLNMNIQNQTVSPKTTTTYTANVYDNYKTKSTTIIVTVNQLPSADFDFTIPCFGSVTYLSYKDNPKKIKSAHWDFDDGDYSDTLYTYHYFGTFKTYNVKLSLTDTNNCSNNKTNKVTILPDLKADYTFTKVCFGKSTYLESNILSTGHTIKSYEWKYSGNNIGTGSNLTYKFPSDGKNSVQLIVIDNNNCTDTVTNDVIVYTNPVAEFSAPTEELGMTTEFTDASKNGSSAINSWSWDFNDPPNSNVQNPDHTFNSPGEFEVTLTVSDGNGCTSSKTNKVTVNKNIHALFYTVRPLCENYKIEFKDVSTIGYKTIEKWEWDFGDLQSGIDNSSNLQNPSHTFKTSGSYIVTLIITGNGMTDKVYHTIFINPIPKIDFDFTKVCDGDETDFGGKILNGVNIDSYLWGFGDNTTDNTIKTKHRYAYASTYDVIFSVLSDSGCRNSITKPVIVYSLPNANYLVNGVMPPPELQTSIEAKFKDLSSATSEGGFLKQWDWYWNDGKSPQPEIHNNNIEFGHTFPESGEFDVILIVTDNHDCKKSVKYKIKVSPDAKANFTFDTVCSDNPTVFKDLSTIGDKGSIEKWVWDFDGVPLTYDKNNVPKTISHNFNYGKHKVILTVTGNNGVSSSCIHYITVWQTPQADFIADNACQGVEVTITDSSTPHDSLNSWKWDFGNNGETGDISSSQLPGPNHILYDYVKSYNVKLLVISNHGCPDSMLKPIIIHPIPEVNFIANIFDGCENPPLEVTFTDLSTISSGNIKTWNWDFGYGTAQSHSPDYATYSYDKSGSYNVSLTLISDNGCESTNIYNNYIAVYPNPKAGFDALPQETLISNPLITFIDKSTNAVIKKWKWNFGDENFDNIQNTMHIYSDTGSFKVQLMVTSDYKCVDSTFLIIKIKDDYKLFIPNAFTPENRDKVNDTFYPKGLGIDENHFEMMIFDRWGGKIFQTSNLYKGWDGKIMGKNETAPFGIYVYKIILSDFRGNQHKETGTVTLLK